MMKHYTLLVFLCLSSFVVSAQQLSRLQIPQNKNSQSLVQNQVPFFSSTAHVLKHVDFHADDCGYSTGVISSGFEGHAQTAPYSFWRRWPDVSASTLLDMDSVYPYLMPSFFPSIDYLLNNLDTASSSAENGWMMISLFDQQTVNSGNFNAYIQIDSIDASNTNLLQVQFYQYYPRQAYDQCYIDYSVDQTNWVSMAINNIPIEASSGFRGFCSHTITLPSSGFNNVSIRLRIKSLNSIRGGYGYCWLVDDVTISEAPQHQLALSSADYAQGNYGQIPYGFPMDFAWCGRARNSGAGVLDSVNVGIYHLNASQDSASLIASYTNSPMAVAAYSNLLCDPAGWIPYPYYPGNFDGAGASAAHGLYVAPFAPAVGDNFIYTAVTADDFSLNADTMFVQVTEADAQGRYTWAHDNGVLAFMPFNHWVYGFTHSGNNWFPSDDPEEVHYYDPGYSVVTRYTTPSSLPDNWVIKGIEMVASPVAGYYEEGAMILPQAQYDLVEDGYTVLMDLLTGAGNKVVTSHDVNDTTVIGRYANGYLTSGYNTIFIPFPEQPSLAPSTSYRIGYKLGNTAHFALAQESQGRYRVASPSRPDTYDTIINFADNPATAKYAHHFAPNQYQTIVCDPGSGNPNIAAFAPVDYNPMIRMIVGPRTDIERVNIGVSCDDQVGGMMVSYGYSNVCDSTLTPAVGSSVPVMAVTDLDARLSVIVDGEEVEPYDEENNVGDPHLLVTPYPENGRCVFVYTFDSVCANHQILFRTSGTNGIDSEASLARLTLLPNPAMDCTTLNIQGVSGMVSCTIVDMSGRVVFDQRISAEEPLRINLSHLSKGAYLVRVTNATTSKVVKLVVR